MSGSSGTGPNHTRESHDRKRMAVACALRRLQGRPELKLAIREIISHRALRRGREARQRVTIKRVGLPRHAVPRTVRVTDYLYRHDHAVVTEFVRLGDPVVYNFSFSVHREFDRPYQVTLVDDLDFIVARVFAHQVKPPKHGFVLLSGFVPGADTREATLHTRLDELPSGSSGLRRVIFYFVGATARFADFLTAIEHLADFLAAV